MGKGANIPPQRFPEEQYEAGRLQRRADDLQRRREVLGSLQEGLARNQEELQSLEDARLDLQRLCIYILAAFLHYRIGSSNTHNHSNL
jgi:hypothetical protein